MTKTKPTINMEIDGIECVQLSTRVPAKLKRALAIHAVKFGTTVQRFVVLTLAERLIHAGKTLRRAKSKRRKG